MVFSLRQGFVNSRRKRNKNNEVENNSSVLAQQGPVLEVKNNGKDA